MSNRVYQLIAVATLVGAPIIVHGVSSPVPSVQQAVHHSEEAREERVDRKSDETSAVTRMAPPPPPSQQSIQPSADPAFSAAPTFDAQGIAPAGTELASDAPQPPPPPPPPPRGTVAEDDVGPPPPRPSAGMDR